MILDIGLPGIDGFEVARRIRATGSRIPILMLTARDGLSDRVTGLDAGADDYVVKPFAYEELAARVRAVHRRVGGATPDAGPQLKIGPIVLDETRRSVTVAGGRGQSRAGADRGSTGPRYLPGYRAPGTRPDPDIRSGGSRS